MQCIRLPFSIHCGAAFGALASIGIRVWLPVVALVGVLWRFQVTKADRCHQVHMPRVCIRRPLSTACQGIGINLKDMSQDNAPFIPRSGLLVSVAVPSIAL